MAGSSGIVKFAVLGCGARGQVFANWIRRNPDQARLVSVADPQEGRRSAIAHQHALDSEAQFEHWEELLQGPRRADVAVITLMDRLHLRAALMAMEKGYHLLLEKPMATSIEDCIAIDDACNKHDRIVSVCHSLRYHSCYAKVKQLIVEDAIGRIVSIDQLEGVEPEHMSHSFVRGNWGEEASSTFMLLAKSCHDLDILSYLVAAHCESVASYGRLTHFKRSQRPPGATDRCCEGCSLERDCPYSAVKLYVEGSVYAGVIGVDKLSLAQRQQFIRETKYGRCVYDLDNDAVDHQVVAMEFAGGITGTFTMTAFAPGGRQLRIHGTHGYLTADIDRNTIELKRFWGNAGTEVISLSRQDGSHGGGDDNTIRCLVEGIRTGRKECVLTGTAESLQSHAIAFAAERSRRIGAMVQVQELLAACR